ncbi:hypothetical protein STCU_09096 [Strigomonas culicis]|uniref:Uncharacterized protein n=1 Tax=Strigomonas culicis TaxID=28005 RepID=S9V016_9TRYP|nr:hypothetical protein STCU_09096 [Strigomonas culicis]|eukprot:EPY20236.1 hypothetical protein STCU_09096 [Strigomonas culicis]
MTLLCELVKKDDKAMLLTGGVRIHALLQRLAKTDGDAAAAAEAAPSGSLLGLYCLFQAMDWELCTVLKAMEDENTAALPRDTEEALARLCACAEQHMDALEDHLIELVLSAGGGEGTARPAAAAKVDVAARIRHFEELTHVMAKAQWPCRLLYTSSGPSPAPAAEPAERPWDLYRALLARLEAVGSGSTAVLKRALLDVARADVFHALDGSVALLRPVGTAAAAVGASEQPRPPLRAEDLSFDALSARILTGAYATAGVRRAQLEGRLLFMHLCQPCGPGEPRHRQMQKLWTVWERAVAHHLAHFFEEEGVERATGGPSPRQSAEPPLSYFQRDDSKLSGTQRKALAVMQRLLLVDTEGWFAVPAFDMRNLDFTSISLWIRGWHFAGKTSGAAFNALVQVLEQMVENCVHTYGPTNMYSERATKVRGQLVDACRREKLL